MAFLVALAWLEYPSILVGPLAFQFGRGMWVVDHVSMGRDPSLLCLASTLWIVDRHLSEEFLRLSSYIPLPLLCY